MSAGQMHNENNRTVHEYCQSFVTFIDVLGIKDAMARKSCTEMVEMYQLVRACLEPLTSVDPDNRKLYAISDSLFYAQKSYAQTEEEWRAEALGVLRALSCAIMRLLKWGITVRGGVAYGLAHIPDDHRGFLFGPMVVDIVDIERVVELPSFGIHESILERIDTDELEACICREGFPCLQPCCALPYVDDREDLIRGMLASIAEYEDRQDAVGEKYRWLKSHVTK